MVIIFKIWQLQSKKKCCLLCVSTVFILFLLCLGMLRYCSRISLGYFITVVEKDLGFNPNSATSYLRLWLSSLSSLKLFSLAEKQR